jgi:hypothetical protein
MMSPNLLTNVFALMAFVVAFYALIARERKTPYITNFIFPPAALLCVTIALLSIEQFHQSWSQGFVTTSSSSGPVDPQAHLYLADWILVISANCIFYFAAIWVVLNIWRLHNRQVNFRDDKRIRNLRIARWAKQIIGRMRTSPTYEHTPEGISLEHLSEPLESCGFKSINLPQETRCATFALCGYPLRKSDDGILRLVAAALKTEWLVQYTTCARHPFEWVSALKSSLAGEWNGLADKIAVVDGYTPHFGFTDSIYAVRTAEVQKEGVAYVRTPESYAGIHTATAQAFNALKSKAGKKKVRQKTLLIYEGCRSLVDLESAEQYRLFLRHVLTSERMWGGMVTVFVEPETDNLSLDVMRAYSDGLCIRSSEGSDGAGK